MAIKQQSVKVNFIMNFILTISNFIFPLLTFPYISRVLTASGVGIITFASSIVAYFSMLGMLGIPTYGIRACARVRNNKLELSKTVIEILILNAMVMFFSLIILIVVVFNTDQLYQEKNLYFILSSALVFNVLGVEWLYKALEKYTYIAVRSILFKFISIILMIALVHSTSDYIIYAAITVFASVGSNVLNFFYLRKIITIHDLRDISLRRHLMPAITFFLLTISVTIYLNVDITLLGFLKGSKEVGYYSAAVKIKQIVVSLVTSLGAVLMPRLTYYYENDENEQFNILIQKALSVVFLLALPLVTYFIAQSRNSILFLSGSSFLPAVIPMKLIMPSVLFIGLSNLMGMQILVPTNREKLVVTSTIIGAFVSFLINSLMVPFMGAKGTAFASTLSELTVALVQFYFLKELLYPMLKLAKVYKIIVSSLVALLVILPLEKVLVWGVFWKLFFSSVVYFAVYIALLLLFKETFTLEVLKSVLKKLEKKNEL